MTDEDWFIDNEDKGFFALRKFRNDFFLVNAGKSFYFVSASADGTMIKRFPYESPKFYRTGRLFSSKYKPVFS